MQGRQAGWILSGPSLPPLETGTMWSLVVAQTVHMFSYFSAHRRPRIGTRVYSLRRDEVVSLAQLHVSPCEMICPQCRQGRGGRPMITPCSGMATPRTVHRVHTGFRSFPIETPRTYYCFGCAPCAPQTKIKLRCPGCRLVPHHQPAQWTSSGVYFLAGSLALS